MWSFVGNKQNQRWLWHAIDHETGKVLAYVIGQHQDSVLLKLKALLKPFGVRHFFTDGWGGYERHISAEQLSIGKDNTQKNRKKASYSAHKNQATDEKNYLLFKIGKNA